MMSGDKAFTVNINSRVAVGTALGVGLMAGAGTAYLLTRLNDHTRLTHQISSLHATIMEVKRDIALLETGLTQKDVDWEEEEELSQAYDRSRSSPGASLSTHTPSRPASGSLFRKKTVSFSSTASAATSATYHTATGYETDTSFTTSAGYDTDVSRATDTDYFSPDEDDDEFFDLTPEDSESTTVGGGNQIKTELLKENNETQQDPTRATDDPLLQVEDEHLAHILQQVDQLSDGSAHDQTQAYHLLRGEEHQTSIKNIELLKNNETQLDPMRATDATLLQAEDEHLASAHDQTRAYHLLRGEEHQYLDTVDFQWRLAKATRNMAAVAEKTGNLKEKETLVFEAYSHAEKALELGPGNAEVHKWFGILSGMRGEYLGMGERVRSGSVFKEHIDQALTLKPQDATLHHLLGRFCYEVSTLSWLERKAAAALFGEVPASTFEEALQHFQAAEDLRPAGWKENRLFLAKCHLQLSNIDAAITWLYQAKVAPIITPDDEIVHREVLDMQQKYS